MTQPETVTRSDAVTVRITGLRGSPRRLRFEPRDDGNWDHYDEEWSGCEWRTKGHEVVEEVGFENVPVQCVGQVV
jgi:hypothetical protein